MLILGIRYFTGWASSGDPFLPGNMGYWDQRSALRFVKENIASFGGDPNRITVFGLSAGGASTNSLTLSPYTRGFLALIVHSCKEKRSKFSTLS